MHLTQVSVAARSLEDARCALCHDALGSAPAVCPRCATALHPDCRRGLERCPTLGCSTHVAITERRPPPPPPTAWESASQLTILSIASFGFLAVTLFGASTIVPQHQGEGSCFLALLLHAILAPAGWAAFQEHPGSPLRAVESRLARFAAAASVLLFCQLVLACVLGLLWLASSHAFGSMGIALPYLVFAIEPALLTWALFGRDPRVDS